MVYKKSLGDFYEVKYMLVYKINYLRSLLQRSVLQHWLQASDFKYSRWQTCDYCALFITSNMKRSYRLKKQFQNFVVNNENMAKN